MKTSSELLLEQLVKDVWSGKVSDDEAFTLSGQYGYCGEFDYLGNDHYAFIGEDNSGNDITVEISIKPEQTPQEFMRDHFQFTHIG